MDYLSEAIKSLKPGAEFVYFGNDYSTIIWHNIDGEPPTKEAIDNEIFRIKAEEINQSALRATQRQAVLDRLGITSEEAKLILGGSN